jgi:hypothetical protein
MAKAPNKVTFNDSIILVDGKEVGRIDGRGEVYVCFNVEGQSYPKAVARFKYRAAKASAKDWVKFILNHMTTAEVVAALADYKESPIGLAQKFGYVSLNEKYVAKKNAEAAARAARPVTIIRSL